jgi:hypothetical protein
MKWCVDFPQEEILMVRPSLNALCLGCKPGAKLLGVLLYRYSIRKEHQEDAENMNAKKIAKGQKPTQDTSFLIYRTQEQIIKDACNEFTTKTLHDIAVPALQLLGFLDIDQSTSMHCYDVHLDKVNEAMAAYKKGADKLEDFHRENLQLELFLIDIKLEEVLMNKNKFYLALEEVLIANGNSSNSKRGPKPKPQAVRDAQNEKRRLSKTNKTVEESEKGPQEETSTSSLDITNDEKKLVTQVGIQPTLLLVNLFRETYKKYPDYPFKTSILESKSWLESKHREFNAHTLYSNLSQKVERYIKEQGKTKQTTPKTTAEKIPTPVTDIADAINRKNNLPPVPTAQQQKERIERLEQQQKARKQA